LEFEDKLVRILEALREHTVIAVQVDGGLSERFDTVIAVMQECVLSPLPFNNILLKVVIALALDRNAKSVPTSRRHKV